MNNHFATFEYEGMKSALVTDYTNQTTTKHFGWKKMSKFKKPKNGKIYLKPKETLHCYNIYLFWVLVSGILNVFSV